MNTQDMTSARGTAKAIIQRIIQDATFADQLRKSPRETLLSAGVHDWAVDDFITHDLGLDPDVAGYYMDRCAVTSFLWIDQDGIEAN